MRIYNCISLIGLMSLWLSEIALAGTPQNVKITNVTGSQFTISWITDVEEIGYIRWGTNTNSLSEIGVDDRDNGTTTPTIKSDTHHITVTSTQAISIGSQTTYYYEIVAGTSTSNVGSITTGTEISGSLGSPLNGYVYRWGPLPATGTILYLNLEGSAGTSALRSILIPSEGSWLEFPGNFRTLDLSAFFNYSENDTLCLYAEGANDGTATLRRKISESKPAPDIIIPPDITSPTTLTVTDDGVYTTNGTQLHAFWQSQDPESGIIEYQYAIGTTQGGTDTVGWTSVGTQTEITRAGLNLVQNTTYYFSTKAKNRAELWSNVGSSNGIKVLVPSPHLPPKVPVYPNPFVPDKSGHNSITFGGINEGRLTKEVTIKIFTIAGELVKTIESSNCNGQLSWTPPHNLASGIYIYLITNPAGEQVKGKLGIIK